MNREYVDLRLSVKWAAMNVGAGKITDLGAYFAWGETAKEEIIIMRRSNKKWWFWKE